MSPLDKTLVLRARDWHDVAVTDSLDIEENRMNDADDIKERYRSAAEDALRDAQDTWREAASHVQEKSQELWEETAGLIRKNPAAAVGIALLGGVALGALFGLRRRPPESALRSGARRLRASIADFQETKENVTHVVSKLLQLLDLTFSKLK